MDILDVADLASALRDEAAAEIVMIAAGAQGNVIACDAWRGLTRPPVVVPVSKVGAGDSFVGGFALSIARGDDPVSACAYGTAAAASAVTRPDTDLCQREATDRYSEMVTRHPL